MDATNVLSEDIERKALQSLHTHCPTTARVALDLRLEEVEDGLIASSGTNPSPLLNRTLGLGTRARVTRATLERVMRAYRTRGVPSYFLHLYPDTLADDARGHLDAIGLRQARGWRKFQRGAEAPPRATTELRIQRVGTDRSLDFGRTVALAFGLGEEGGPLLAGLAQDPRWHLFVSYEGNTPAGAGGLMIEGNVGWLEWGATAPAFRKRGSQGAIMATRIQAARDAGCETLFTETGEAVEGDPQHSYRNIQRYGFSQGQLRENWKPR